MKFKEKVLPFINRLSYLALVILLLLIFTDMINESRYTYEASHEVSIKAKTQDLLHDGIKVEIEEFGPMEVHHLSGKSFKVEGSYYYLNSWGTKKEQKFECVVSGFDFEEEPWGYLKIDMYKSI